MSEATLQHSPGPWVVEIHIPRGSADAEYNVLAPNPDHGRKSVCYSGRYLSVARGLDDEANARLIAAAPEMLEALKEIHKLWCCPAPKTMRDWSARCDVMADYARAAIAKAEGR